MHLLTRYLAYALILAFGLYVAPATGEEMPQVGHGLICDTPDQLRQIVEATDSSHDFNASVAKVNAGTNACGMAQIAFIRGNTVGQVRTAEGLRDIAEIQVVGVVMPMGIHP